MKHVASPLIKRQWEARGTGYFLASPLEGLHPDGTFTEKAQLVRNPQARASRGDQSLENEVPTSRAHVLLMCPGNSIPQLSTKDGSLE